MRGPCLFGLAVAGVFGDSTFSGYITDQDRHVLDLADQRTQLYCHGGAFQGSVDEAAGKQSLLSGLGNRNVALEVLKKADRPEAVGKVFMEDFGEPWLAKQGHAIVMAVAAQLLCLLFCGLSCCRCCAYERPTQPILKKYAAGVIAVVLLGIFVCTLGTLGGYSQVHNGLFNVQCSSVRLFDTLLKGEGAEAGSFRGLLPVLEEFEKAEATLDHGSDFMTGMENIIRMTDDVNRSATLASGTLRLLQDMMHENRWLHDAKGKDLLHECKFCQALLKTLETFDATYSQSPAMSLAAARHRLTKESMTPSDRAHMKADLRQSAERLLSVKQDVVRAMEGMLVEPGWMKVMYEAEHAIEAAALAAVLLVGVVALCLSLCAGVSVYRFTFKEMDAALEEKGENPYNPSIHKYAHATWCCGFCYLTTALLVAGVIFVVSAPAAGVCLLLDDLDSRTLGDIAPALDLDLDSNGGTDVATIITQCLHPQNEQPEAYFLDLLFTKQNGSPISERSNILRVSKHALESRLRTLTYGAEQPAPPLARSDEVKALLDQLGLPELDAMLTGAADKLRHEDAYADMAIPSAGLSGFLGSSLACEDFAVPPGLGGGTVLGVKSLSDKLATMGRPRSGSGGSCAAPRVDCTTGGFREHSCRAANRYLDLKEEARGAAVFRCDMFQAPGDPATVCDPLHMQSDDGLDGTIWSEDCLDPDGRLARKTRTCSLPEFADYVRAFGPRLQKVLERLDAQMQSEQPGMRSAMRALVEEHVLRRSDFLANGVTCSFFAAYYQELINGSCYQGVYGLRVIAKSYVWCALLAAMLTFSMYAVWCRSKGNIENWKADRTEYKALLQKEKDAEEARSRANRGADEENATWILVDPNDPARRVTAPSDLGPPRADA